jgi:hypothetical protein
MIEGPLASLLRGWLEIFLPIFRRPSTIRVDVVYLLGVAALIIIVVSWPCSFITVGYFSLLFELVEVQDL